MLCSYNGQEDGRVGLYIAAEPLTRDKNYFEVEIVDAGAMGTVGQCPSHTVKLLIIACLNSRNILICSACYLTRKLCYSKDDRTMHPIYECLSCLFTESD